ncbi:MAG: VOC family protein [Woeseiaceae bacterium]|nr:VOC family protein [Woeseiaceae bacterium]
MPKLAHVCIETDDLDKTEKFYEAIGLERRFEFRNLEDELVGFYLAFDDNSYIEVIKTGKPKPEGNVRHFAIEVEDVDDIHEKLTAAGATVSDKEFCKDRIWMVTCRDPNGIFIEFQQYTSDSMQLKGGVCEVDYTP